MTLTTKSANAKDARTAARGPQLEHRHFATIAAIIHDLPRIVPRGAVAEHFAARLARTNPRFDRDRFLAACGLKGWQS